MVETEQMKLEDMMLKEGWKRTVRTNAGKIYTEWHKNGFVIDESDILEDK